MKTGRALCLMLCWLPLNASSEVWEAVLPDSQLTFTAIQQRAEFKGRFHRFSATVKLEPGQPEQGELSARIDLGSVDTAYADRDKILAEPEWFNSARWPEASFTADTLTRRETGYVAMGTLSLRNVSRVVPLEFEFEQLDTGQARMRGQAVINRLDFGVGQGDWADTGWVGPEVRVYIDLLLRPAADPETNE